MKVMFDPIIFLENLTKEKRKTQFNFEIGFFDSLK